MSTPTIEQKLAMQERAVDGKMYIAEHLFTADELRRVLGELEQLREKAQQWDAEIKVGARPVTNQDWADLLRQRDQWREVARSYRHYQSAQALIDADTRFDSLATEEKQ